MTSSAFLIPSNLHNHLSVDDSDKKVGNFHSTFVRILPQLFLHLFATTDEDFVKLGEGTWRQKACLFMMRIFIALAFSIIVTVAQYIFILLIFCSDHRSPFHLCVTTECTLFPKVVRKLLFAGPIISWLTPTTTRAQVRKGPVGFYRAASNSQRLKKQRESHTFCW